MASRSNAGCLGWLVAGALLLALIGQCSEDGAPTTASTVASLADDAISEPETTVAYRRFVRPATANCRASGSVGASPVEQLTRNSVVGVIRSEDGWSLIDRATDCWVRDDLLDRDYVVAPVQVRAFSSAGDGSGRARSGTSSGGSAYYRNCAAARAAGAAPVYRGDPGYARRLDRDGDGVGCE